MLLLRSKIWGTGFKDTVLRARSERGPAQQIRWLRHRYLGSFLGPYLPLLLRGGPSKYSRYCKSPFRGGASKAALLALATSSLPSTPSPRAVSSSHRDCATYRSIYQGSRHRRPRPSLEYGSLARSLDPTVLSSTQPSLAVCSGVPSRVVHVFELRAVLERSTTSFPHVK